MSELSLPKDFGNTPKKNLVLPENFTGLIVHCCCAPCAGAMFEFFKVNKLNPIIFFYNPNIHPKDEYVKRRDELIKLANLLDFKTIIGDYDTKTWFELTKGLEHEPERGNRCEICFTHRLQVTALLTKKLGLSHFTSTLATSRWKKKELVDKAGFKAQASVNNEALYWDEDWRKQGLVTRRYELVKKFNFYNQLYCGCVFSKINNDHYK